MTNKRLLLYICPVILIGDYFGFKKLILKCIPLPEYLPYTYYSKFVRSSVFTFKSLKPY